ncbi:hypothetical protein GGR53DRAFT_509557 [Hypoxylon sp. FL1150]|nr:hypothetical protein GGR53DRAFT_509557 [Hypoxylon sp. FL1150]
MVVWGKGLMQSDDDYLIESDLCDMLGLHGMSTDPKSKEAAREKLNGGILAQKFDKIVSPSFQPRTRHHQRSRVAIVLGIFAMRVGATIESRHMAALKVLRPWLPTMEQQLQLVTALDEYKNNGKQWVIGSKNRADTVASARTRGKRDFDLGDEFWFSGLGHSVDEKPTSEMASKMCLECGEKEGDLLRCGRCKMARYCNKTCQKNDWSTHKNVCYARDKVRYCRVPGASHEEMAKIRAM